MSAIFTRSGVVKVPRPRREALMLRRTWGGHAARWAARQGTVSLSLHVAGLAALAVSAFTIAAALGWAVVGISCLVMEYLTREDSP